MPYSYLPFASFTQPQTPYQQFEYPERHTPNLSEELEKGPETPGKARSREETVIKAEEEGTVSR